MGLGLRRSARRLPESHRVLERIVNIVLQPWCVPSRLSVVAMAIQLSRDACSVLGCRG